MRSERLGRSLERGFSLSQGWVRTGLTPIVTSLFAMSHYVSLTAGHEVFVSLMICASLEQPTGESVKRGSFGDE
jgi:hypothetical protein